MSDRPEILSLARLEYSPYVDDSGMIPESPFQGKVGVYAIFDRDRVLQFIGYSRDIYLSLKQHLIRQPQHCFWIKFQTISRPNRMILETIKEAWISENGRTPPGNDTDETQWTQPIDVKPLMTDEERTAYDNAAGEELAQMKLLKKVSRRVEADILEQLKSRGVQMELRFNPKLKETGLLDLK
ncbi:MAG TPA: GIY-YIG nuclease family protein [Oscillatoriales cyanobacterium M59_W2019_021]|nr:MAG: GIY-YIG nuclease family protein [Cyanobacteria bacterium J055]HIK31646.1 GIY-YIG nuclease family protein [Oscillatoriales cyanobacterium M4454_W2019_049]HIK50345.1 GIY-YIG nuclease family protein [Oscillatoriales cyanobacterium M59_W2019_021]